MSIAPLEARPVLIDQVHDRLVNAVVEGTLAPGRRLTQDELAVMLGVSRQPVSHALQLLKKRGLFVEHGKRGLMVAPIDGQRILDLYQVREALDGLAASLAAVRAAAGHLAEAEIAEAGATLARGLELSRAAAISELVAADVAFHTALYRLSGNSAIAETVADEWPHFIRSMGLVLATAGMPQRVWREHADILAAILAGRSAEAERLARQHTSKAGSEMASRLEQRPAVA